MLSSTRLFMTGALLLCASYAAAVETPLTLASDSSRQVVVDPSYGSITIYEVTVSNSNRLGLGKPQPNFLSDANIRLNSFYDEVEGEPYAWLRLGGLTKPAYGDMFRDGKWFSNKPTKKEAAAGKADAQTRALRAEHAFWKTQLAYDGVVSAALTPNGQDLLIVLPGLHALLWYRLDGDSIVLKAWRNYGPELMMTGFNTSPDPSALLARVPKEKQAEAKTALGLDEEAAPAETAAPAGSALATEEPPTPKSEVWTAAASGDTFLVVDTANSRAMLYRVGKFLELVSVRDLAVDLVVPGLVGGGLASDPMGDRMLETFLKDRRKAIAEYGLPNTREEILLAVGQKAAKGKVSPFEATASAKLGLAVLNFIDKRVMLTLNTAGGQSLALAAARDYTLDIAVALLDEEISHRKAAEDLVANAAQLGKSNKRKAALLTVRQALSLDPRQHKGAEKALKGAFKNDAEMLAQFQTMLDEAAKKTEELEKLAAERRKAMEEKAKAK
ncbi:MAG TPA: hypothetical protein DCS97_10635 [Planctomycetes bacterium]|nr:hypothetical protein [Planctomycetota bacterium]